MKFLSLFFLLQSIIFSAGIVISISNCTELLNIATNLNDQYLIINNIDCSTSSNYSIGPFNGKNIFSILNKIFSPFLNT